MEYILFRLDARYELASNAQLYLRDKHGYAVVCSFMWKKEVNYEIRCETIDGSVIWYLGELTHIAADQLFTIEELNEELCNFEHCFRIKIENSPNIFSCLYTDEQLENQPLFDLCDPANRHREEASFLLKTTPTPPSIILEQLLKSVEA
uniref:DUF1830 domain-containing protein n=1 Tax=Romanomermis culicivorax TaxID=13658 RepID=A0A915HRE5_ROMCU